MLTFLSAEHQWGLYHPIYDIVNEEIIEVGHMSQKFHAHKYCFFYSSKINLFKEKLQEINKEGIRSKIIKECLFRNSFTFLYFVTKSLHDQYLMFKISMENNLIAYFVDATKIIIIQPRLFCVDKMFDVLNKDVVSLIMKYLLLDSISLEENLSQLSKNMD